MKRRIVQDDSPTGIFHSQAKTLRNQSVELLFRPLQWGPSTPRRRGLINRQLGPLRNENLLHRMKRSAGRGVVLGGRNVDRAALALRLSLRHNPLVNSVPVCAESPGQTGKGMAGVWFFPGKRITPLFTCGGPGSIVYLSVETGDCSRDQWGPKRNEGGVETTLLQAVEPPFVVQRAAMYVQDARRTGEVVIRFPQHPLDMQALRVYQRAAAGRALGLKLEGRVCFARRFARCA